MALKFEELKVWQKSLDLSLMVHNATLKFPKEEQFILSPQIKRAADSVSLNIAEGSTGQSDSEFSRFFRVCIKIFNRGDKLYSSCSKKKYYFTRRF